MEAIICEFRVYLQTLIEDEQRRLGLRTAEMLAFMQGHVSLPEFYKLPACAAAAQLCKETGYLFPDEQLSEALQEAVKAVYGAWIREKFRDV